MEIRQIRYAEAVAHYGNFSKAAAAMFVTQQSISQQIKALEDELGFAIFDRTTRSVTLTNLGKVFIQRAESLLSQFDTFSSELPALREEGVQKIRFGILPTFSHLDILGRIYQFQAQRPDVFVQLQIQKSSNLVDMVCHNRLDIAVANLSHRQIDALRDEYETLILAQDELCVLMNRDHPYADKEAVSLAQLQGQALLLTEKGTSLRTQVDATAEELKLHFTSVFDCPEIYSMVGMLQSGVGIGFLSSHIARQFVSDALTSVPVVPKIDVTTALLYRREPSSPEIEMLAGCFQPQK